MDGMIAQTASHGMLREKLEHKMKSCGCKLDGYD